MKCDRAQAGNVCFLKPDGTCDRVARGEIGSCDPYPDLAIVEAALEDVHDHNCDECEAVLLEALAALHRLGQALRTRDGA